MECLCVQFDSPTFGCILVEWLRIDSSGHVRGGTACLSMRLVGAFFKTFLGNNVKLIYRFVSEVNNRLGFQ